MSIELRPDEARAVAFLLNRIRPDWQIESTMKVLGQHKQVPSLAELTIAAVIKARQDSARTPATIFIEGDHWPKPTKMKLAPAPKCEDHPTETAEHCHCCWADIRVGDRPEHMLGKQLEPKTNPTTKPIDWGAIFESVAKEPTAPIVAETTRGVAPF